MKKYIMLMFLFTVAAFAGENYTITVPNEASVNNTFDILNFVASLFQSGVYMSLLKLVAMAGGLVAFVTAIIKTSRGDSGGLKDFGWYLVGVTALLTVFGSATSTIEVRTNNLGSYYYGDYTADVATAPTTGVVVGNIPDMYAYGISFFSTFDSEINRLFEMGLSSVTSYNLTNYAGDMKETMQLLQTDLSRLDPAGFKKLQAVMNDCVIMPMTINENLGEIKTAVYETKNLSRTLDDLLVNSTANTYDSILPGATPTLIAASVTNNGMPFQDLFVTYGGNTYTCSQLWSEVKTISIPGMKQALARTHNDIGAGSVELLTGQSHVPQSSFEETAINAGLLNMVKNSESYLANGQLEYAAGKTKAEFIQQGIASGYHMSGMIPHMKYFIMNILYTLFPLIFAFSLFPKGYGILVKYAQTFLWVTMWAPVGSVLNYFITSFIEATTKNDLSVANAANIMSDMGTYAGMAGYLYLMVPALSWLILTGSGTMLQGLGAGIAANLNANVTSDGMSKDLGRLTKQQEYSKKRGETIAMAEIDQLEAKNQAYSSTGDLVAFDTVGSEKMIAHSQLEKQSAIQGSHKKLLAGGGMEKTVDVEAKMNEKNFREGKGWQDQVNGDMNVANSVGRDKAIQDKGTDFNLKTNGEKMLQNVANKSKLEGTVSANERFNQIEKTKSVTQHGKDKAKVDYAAENASVNKFDMNGDGQTSDKELAKGAKVLDNQEKLDQFSKDRNQQELKKEAKDYKQSSSARIQNAMNGTPAALGEMGQAAGAKIAANSEVSTFNDRKEVKKVENFKSQNVAPEKLASTESAEEMQKVMKVDSEANTLKQNMGEIVGQHKELRQELAEDFMSKGMSKSEADKMAGKVMLGALADIGIANKDLTLGEIANDFAGINAKEQNALNALVNSKIGTNGRGKLEFLKYSERMLAQQEPGSKGEAIWKENVAKARENATVSQDQVNDILNSGEAKAITDNFENKRREAVAQYGNLARINENGEVEAADTMAALNDPNVSENEKLFMIKQINGGLQGKSVTFNDLKGMERKVVVDINGNKITDSHRAEQAYVKEGNFKHEVMYQAGKSDIVAKDNLAVASTVVSHTATVFGAKTIKDGILRAVSK